MGGPLSGLLMGSSGAILSSVASGGIGGGVRMAVIGVIKNMMAKS